MSFADGVVYHLTGYVEAILTLEPTAILVLQLGSAIVGAILWIDDGRPGATETIDGLRHLLERLRG